MTSAVQNTPSTIATHAPPPDDSRHKALEASMKRHHHQPDALIEVLHSAQELFGYLSDDLLLHVANSLKLPPSHVYGVATFYHFFALKPKGEHRCVICTGTACYFQGAGPLVDAVERAIGIGDGETTPDGKITLETVRCPGTCGLAPVVEYDGDVGGRQTPAEVVERVKGWVRDGSE
jgi:bidirectional [NiFe] hydrogenase diaphorase subunit